MMRLRLSLTMSREKEPGGRVRPMLGLPLQTGEHAIVNQTNVGKMFDFGVD